jgi:hypothetical protein
MIVASKNFEELLPSEANNFGEDPFWIPKYFDSRARPVLLAQGITGLAARSQDYLS